MPLFLKTVRGVCKFCQQLALSSRMYKVDKNGNILTLYVRLVPSAFCFNQVHWRKTYSIKPFNASQFPTFRLLIKWLTAYPTL